MQLPRIIRSSVSRSTGFSLLEIAVVLVIVSLLIAAGVGMTTAVLDGARIRTTRQNLESVKLALQAFISRNGRLPCPAVENLPRSDENFGIEATTAGTCTGTTDLPGLAGPPAIDSAKRGVLPWKSLGLNSDASTDGWGNQFTYLVTTTATSKTFDTVSGMRGSLYVHSASPVVVGLPPTGNQVNACSISANDNVCNKAAVVVVISHGRNGQGGYTTAGLRLPLPSGASEIENTNDDRFVVNAEPGPDFDDLMMPLAPDDFIGPLAIQGAVKSERALLLERARQFVTLLTSDVTSCCRDGSGGAGNAVYSLPIPVSTTAYTFIASKFGATCDSNPPNTVGLLPNPSPTWDAKQLRDPWNQEFRYQCANCDINSGESCPSPAVIVSLGPDGILGTADDWVYYISLGELKDYFARTGW